MLSHLSRRRAENARCCSNVHWVSNGPGPVEMRRGEGESFPARNHKVAEEQAGPREQPTSIIGIGLDVQIRSPLEPSRACRRPNTTPALRSRSSISPRDSGHIDSEGIGGSLLKCLQGQGHRRLRQVRRRRARSSVPSTTLSGSGPGWRPSSSTARSKRTPTSPGTLRPIAPPRRSRYSRRSAHRLRRLVAFGAEPRPA